MATTKPKPKPKKRDVKVKVPAVSVVRPPRADLDVGQIKLKGKTLSAKLRNAITDASLESTIEGASVLAITVSDWHEGLLHSQLIKESCTVIFDGESYTLTKLSRADAGAMTLTFEDTAVNLLRQYTKPKKANRANTTRAQFIRSLVQEVKEGRIAFYCPEVDVEQPIAGKKAAAAARSPSVGGKPNAGGWITTGATWFTDCPGAYGNLCDGGLYYAELGQAGANAAMGGLLGKALGGTGPLAPGTKLQITFNGRTVTATKKDIGSGQLGDRHYTIDLHQKTAETLNFVSAGRADVKLRKVS